MKGLDNKIFAHQIRSISFPVRVFILLLLASVVLIAVLGKYFTDSFQNNLINNVRTLAMNQAKIIASMDSIVSAVENKDTHRLQTIADKLNSRSDFDYIVIGDENSIRLYHPNSEKIGFMMQWNKPGAMARGESYFIDGEGSIGGAIRAKTPIFNANNKVIGVVSIGYLTKTINVSRAEFLVQTAGAFLAILVILLFFSWGFSRHIRRQMLGMEPQKIVQVVMLQNAIFDAVFEGIIAIDCDGNIIAINHNARQMLGIIEPEKSLIGRPISSVITPVNFFLSDTSDAKYDQLSTFNGLNVISSRIAIMDGQQQMGSVVSFRSQNDIESLNTQLTQVKQYVENLRTLRHEHLNWMSTLGGLIQMGEYQQALAMIKGESASQQQLIDSLRGKFADKQVAGLLFGKYHRAKELGLTLEFIEGCQLSEIPAKLTSTEFCAILGNLLNNAFEASLKNPQGNKQIELYLSDEGKEIVIEVADQGCGFPKEGRDNYFERGITTKIQSPEGHGIGLYLIASYVKRCQGVMIIEDNDPCGTLFSIFIPKVKIPNDKD
ncbi:sensor histidine kinase DpiB [Moellerella wisconsensis]|uniref:histidine kinase n=1 Tax=Moellerella wisconsensis ATCC 35017 TaxID=1354267 RepID=A0A0N0I9K7_9GAMM|nr:sensor histidine kinase DpiB [Moellerella wisconsensis]KPD02263.1 sensor kinase [Moellerella wisconsensis ATCC 35017]VFS53919.1 Sensor histidine kinase DpiB [Moellerella wisconsensis]